MKKISILKKAAPFLLTAAMMLGISAPAFAASKEQVDGITLEVNYELSNGMSKSDIDISCDDEEVSSVSISSVTNNEYGKKPKVTLKVKADSDYSFKISSGDNKYTFSKNNISLTGDEATLTKCTVSSSSLSLTLTLPKIGSTDDSALDVEDVSWTDEEDGTVEWEQADDADKYEVKLLRGSSTKETITTTDTSHNFRSVIRSNGKGTYRVKVRAVAGTYKGDWTESDDFDVDEDVLEELGGKSSSGSSSSGSSSGSGSYNPGSGTAKGAWLKDSYGWWYCNADRSYTTNNWQQIDGYWYYFNANGYMMTGWLQSPYSGLWYWLSTDSGTYGRMLTSQWVDNGKYYVDGSGVWTGQTR